MDTSFAVLEGVSTLPSGREAAPDVVRYLSDAARDLAKCLRRRRRTPPSGKLAARNH